MLQNVCAPLRGAGGGGVPTLLLNLSWARAANVRSAEPRSVGHIHVCLFMSKLSKIKRPGPAVERPVDVEQIDVSISSSSVALSGHDSGVEPSRD